MPVLAEDGKPRKRRLWPLWSALGAVAALPVTAVILPFAHPITVHLPAGRTLHYVGRHVPRGMTRRQGYTRRSFPVGAARLDIHRWRVAAVELEVAVITAAAR